jgi:hypothetical protein
MIASQIVIGVAMGQRAIPDMLLVSRIIIQMNKAGYGLGTAMLISSKVENPLSCQTLLIRFDSYASLVLRKELPTLFSTAEFAPTFLTGSGESTQGLTSIKATLISRLRKRLIMTGLFIKYLC